eukprot:177557-Chlamydomonas_euryale.AAC.8
MLDPYAKYSSPPGGQQRRSWDASPGAATGRLPGSCAELDARLSSLDVDAEDADAFARLRAGAAAVFMKGFGGAAMFRRGLEVQQVW